MRKWISLLVAVALVVSLVAGVFGYSIAGAKSPKAQDQVKNFMKAAAGLKATKAASYWVTEECNNVAAQLNSIPSGTKMSISKLKLVVTSQTDDTTVVTANYKLKLKYQGKTQENAEEDTFTLKKVGGTWLISSSTMWEHMAFQPSVQQDDHGNSTDTATLVPLSQDIAGTFNSQQDLDVFAWLASESGVYRITVVPHGGGKVEATIFSQDAAGSTVREVKKAADSKLVDMTVAANRPSIYFVQLQKSDKTKVEDYTLRIDPTEDQSLPPEIDAMPHNGNAGDTINIFGTGFGGGSGSVQFGKAVTAPVIMWSPQQIIAQIPYGSGAVDVVVKTAHGNMSDPFRFTYGPKLGDDVIQQVRDWAKSRIPDAEERLKEAEDRMWETYTKAEESYQSLKETKGTEVFQDIDQALTEASWKIDSVALGKLAKVLTDEATRQGKSGFAVEAPFLAHYALAALGYFQIGKWAAMDAVLIARNIKSQWYTWAVLSPAVKEYEKAQQELDILRKAAETTTATASSTSTPAVSGVYIVSPDGWGWQNPLLPRNELDGVWGSSGSDVFAVGYGTILHYDGSSWSSMSSGTSGDLNAVWGSSGSDVFAVGDDGIILHYDGSRWSSMSSGTSNHLLGVWGSSGKDVFAVGDHVGEYGVIYHYNGSIWSSMSSGTSEFLKDVWGSSGSDVFAVGSRGTIRHFDGSKWNYVSSGIGMNLNNVWGSSGKDVFAVGSRGTILQYNGSRWRSMSSYTEAFLQGVWGSSGKDVFAVGYSAIGSRGVILHYDGSSWSSMSSGTTETLNGVWGSSGSDIFAVGYSAIGSRGVILHYDGSSWSSMSSGTSDYLNDVWGSSGSDVFAVGEHVGIGGVILHYDGSSWSEMSRTPELLRGVWGSSGKDVFAVGLGGYIWHYDGSNWKSMSSGTSEFLLDVWGSSSRDVFSVSLYGTILHYNGNGWSSMSSGISKEIVSVWGNSGSDVFAMVRYGSILHYNGSRWSSMSSGTTETLNGVWGSSGSDIFAVGDRGTILHYFEQQPNSLIPTPTPTLTSTYTPFPTSTPSPTPTLTPTPTSTPTPTTTPTPALATLWPMFRHDAQHTGRCPDNYEGPTVPTMKWSQTVDNTIEGGWLYILPVVAADGTIYVNSGKDLYSLNKNGALQWSYSTGYNTMSSPAIGTDGTIYVASDKLYALNSDGSLKWQYATGSTIGDSPTIGEDGTIYMNDGDLYAIHPDGSLKWRYEPMQPDFWETPAIGHDGTVYIMYGMNVGDHELYAINPDGTIKWTYKTQGEHMYSPAIGDDNTIYTECDKLYALNPDGTIKWTFAVETGSGPPAVGGDGTVYVSSGGKPDDIRRLYAINPDGTLKWNYTANDLVSSPAISSDGTVYVGADKLYALNPDGTLKWEWTGVRGKYYHFESPILAADGIIYVGFRDMLLTGKTKPEGQLLAIGSSTNLK